MPSFNTRLARLADQVRELQGGAETARALIALADDLDRYLRDQTINRHDSGVELFKKWNEFLNASVAEAHDYHKQKEPIERRRIARVVAGDPRWSGGYAEALALLEKAE